MVTEQVYLRLMRRAVWFSLVGLTSLVLGCASTKNRAPVESRAAPRHSVSFASAVARPRSNTPLPGAENADKPGYYSVRPGDTLIQIGLESGQHWKDLAQWNNVENPNIIEVGQVLRVVPTSDDAGEAADPRPVPNANVETRPLEARPAAAGPTTSVAASGAALVGSSAPTSPATIARKGNDDLTWAWPANGPIVSPFKKARSKGLAISGQAGDPVTAAADGRVVYAGSGLRGYGNLLILKHNSTYLTAYAHNQALLVKEEQVVHRGQKIAEMGSTDAERVQLHFEIRRLGKPVDPITLLPPRQ